MAAYLREVLLLADHFEKPERTAHLYEVLQEEGLAGRCWQLKSREVASRQISLCKHRTVSMRKRMALYCRCEATLSRLPAFMPARP